MRWNPEVLETHPVKHVAITLALAKAIERGELCPGDRLPTHRSLADQLGVTIGTVSRAYAEAARLGLSSGEVGRGSFVRHRPASRFEFRSPDQDSIPVDLSQNFPLGLALEEELLAKELSRQAESLGRNASAAWSRVSDRVQAAGRAWMQRCGYQTEDTIHPVLGPQSAIAAALAAGTHPGDTVLAAELTHPGLKAIANQFHLNLVSLAMDREGILPEALEKACRELEPKLLFCQPTIQTPCAGSMSMQRRQEICRVLNPYQTITVEFDDSAVFFEDPPPPLTQLRPERSILIADSTRALSLGLRTTFLRVPDCLEEDFADAQASLVWMGVPLLASIASDWILGDVADALISARREELARRHGMLSTCLAGMDFVAPTEGHHCWLTLPTGQRVEAFVSAAAQQGIAVTSAEWFHIGPRHAPDAVRICHASAADAEVLGEALEKLTGLLQSHKRARPPAS
ncbi:MAG: aminotransferase-like domain-containing protein [Planctomycetota bacterium]|jgi:DNA-binding transcriptional MocR family regulator